MWSVVRRPKYVISVSSWCTFQAKRNERTKEEGGKKFGEVFIIIFTEFCCLRHDDLDNSMTLKYIKLNENKQTFLNHRVAEGFWFP